MKSTASLRQIVPKRERFRFPHSLIGLIRAASLGTIRRVIVFMVIAWVPAAILAAYRGIDLLRSFLMDYAAQSRLLVVIPILILAEPLLVARLEAVARHFREEGLVDKADLPHFEAALSTLTRLGDTLVVRVFLLLLVYTFLALMMSVVQTSALMPWCFGEGGVANLSPAGSWYIMISLPSVLYLLLRWVWRQLLWLWFLGVTSRLDLKLIPSHPDQVGGISFVEICMRGYLPLGFAIGTIVAGAVANRVVYLHLPLASFRYVPLFVIAAVVVVCAGPLCVFWDLLVRTRRRGIFEYGALAIDIGRQFEQKWLALPVNAADSALGVPDFSATTDLYSIVANVHEMRPFPVGMRSLSRLAAASLAPAVPLLFLAVPFDVIMEHVIKLLI